MTKKELNDFIIMCITMSDPPYPTIKIGKLVDGICGQPFDGETEKIRPATEQSSATLTESFPDGTTYTRTYQVFLPTPTPTQTQ